MPLCNLSGLGPAATALGCGLSAKPPSSLDGSFELRHSKLSCCNLFVRIQRRTWRLANDTGVPARTVLEPCIFPTGAGPLLWDRRWLKRCVETVATALREVVDPSKQPPTNCLLGPIPCSSPQKVVTDKLHKPTREITSMHAHNHSTSACSVESTSSAQTMLGRSFLTLPRRLDTAVQRLLTLQLCNSLSELLDLCFPICWDCILCDHFRPQPLQPWLRSTTLPRQVVVFFFHDGRLC